MLEVKEIEKIVHPGSLGLCSTVALSPIFAGHSFAAPWAIMMHRSSIENIKPYLFAIDLKHSITAILRYEIFIQTNPRYIVLIY